MKKKLFSIIGDQKGAVLIWFVLFLPILIGMVAMAVDVSRLAVAKNELQNAADAGALAAARFLYNDPGTSVNTGANQIGYDAATANKSQNLAVEVNWSGGNTGDVQRGHWSFGRGALPRGFTPNASTAPVNLWDVSTEALDGNPNLINAVRVNARRESTPIISYFARIFGIDSWAMQAAAVAYIGFAGRLMPTEVDQPIAICSESLLINGEYSCSIGRMINSGQDTETNETGGWTSFNQDDACTGGTNAQEVSSLVCSGGNPDGIQLGVPMATNGGDIQSAFSDLFDCWETNTSKNQIWNLTLPVVTCPSNNVGTCEEVTGAVNLNIVWISGAGEDPQFNNAPTQMGVWSAPAGTESNGEARWNSFVTYFNLQNADGTPAPYAKKSIYFLPDCTVHEPAGGTGGENFGILAKIPVLVE
jgi:Flp pilus assembly protein TadG